MSHAVSPNLVDHLLSVDTASLMPDTIGRMPTKLALQRAYGRLVENIFCAKQTASLYTCIENGARHASDCKVLEAALGSCVKEDKVTVQARHLLQQFAYVKCPEERHALERCMTNYDAVHCADEANTHRGCGARHILTLFHEDLLDP
mmetsp:Transcript_151581/g.264831  ORF Transcript_151581/g.264831 Transcript_151581/m.264831 type:complete len:147 (-) Transcript_151581:851-1291(-)